MPPKLNNFIDVPKIIKEDRVKEFFPGLLPDVDEIRKIEFPSLVSSGRTYMDSGATAQPLASAIRDITNYRLTYPRGSNHSENSEEAKRASQEYNRVKDKLTYFFNASDYMVGFTGGTTDTSNWISTRFDFKKGDLIVLTEMEHNSQILTPLNFAKMMGVDIEIVPITKPEGRLDLDYLRKIMKTRKKGKILFNLIHVSNVTGVINPISEIRDIVGDRGFIYLDMAQSAGHMKIDLNALDVDFASLSAHKMYGPFGLGAIFINKKSERYLGNHYSGGSTVKLVSKNLVTYEDSVARFEPGTQAIEPAIEFGFVIDRLYELGMDNIHMHDIELGKYMLHEMKKIPNLNLYGPKTFEDRLSILTFNLGSFLRKNYKEVACRLDAKGISVRDGCFCAHWYIALMMGLNAPIQDVRNMLLKLGISQDFLGLPKQLVRLPGAVRVTPSFYNTIEEAYTTIQSIAEVAEDIL